MKDIIKVTSNELKGIDDRIDKMNKLTLSFHGVRQEQILNELKMAGKARSRMMKRLSRWLSLLDNAIFDPAKLSELTVPQILSLLKFVSTLNLKTIASTNKLDDITVKYFEILSKNSDREVDTVKEIDEESKEINAVKKEVLDLLKKTMYGNTVEVTPVEKELKEVKEVKPAPQENI